MGSLNYRLVIGFIISLLWSGHLFAQKFHSINARFGISVREANSVCKDDNGFIWASSKTGIIRITDDDYRHYPLPYESANAITVELFSAPSHLYAFTNNGQLFSYNPILDRFELLVNLSTILNDSYLNTFSILIDSSGVFWMALSSGLYKYESGELKFVEKFFSDRATMTWFDSRQIIIATTEAIWLFDIQSLSKICLHQYD
jgi:ligand-binding sensor domain-containing protein